MQSLILLYIFLINWHYFVEICFHIDIKEVFFFAYLLFDIYKSNEMGKQLGGWILFSSIFF